MKNSESFTKEDITYQGVTPVRLDVFLSNAYETLTRSFWTNMIHAGYVEVEGNRVKPGYKLKPAQSVIVYWPKITDTYSSLVTILYEDKNCMVVNKPAGMLVHSKGAFNPEYTLADFIKSHSPESSESENPRHGIVHRLDRHTSGVMILAKYEATLTKLQSQFSNRLTRKWYVALVEGRVEKRMNIDVPLARDIQNPKRFAAVATGKSALTDVFPIEYLEDQRISLVLLSPRTGRTHQLRVHMSHIGHPIVGDKLYGSQTVLEGARFLLHAYQLDIQITDSTDIKSFVAPIPEDMSSYMNNARQTTISTLIKQASK